MSPSRHKRSASTSSPPRAPPPPPPVMAPSIRRMGSSGPYEPPPPPVIEGWLRKPGSRLSTHKIWNERYFVLRGSTLSYYVRRADVKPRGAFQLTPDCTVSEVYLCSRKDKGNHLNVQRQQEEDKREVANVGPRISPVPSSHGSVEEGGEGDVSGGAVAAVESSQTNKKEKKEKKKSRGRETMYCIKLTWDNPNGGSERSDSKAAAPTGMDSAMSSAHLQQQQQQQQQQQDGGANGTRLSQHRPSLHVDESNNNNNPTTTASGAASPIPEECYEDQESPAVFRQQQHPPTTIVASFSADEYDTTGMGPTPAATAAASNSRNSRESTPIRRSRSVETFSNNKSPTAATSAAALSASMTTTPSSRKSRHHRRKTSDGPPASLLQQRPLTPPRRSRTDEGEQGTGSEVRSPNTSTSPVPGEGVVLPVIPNLDHPIASRSNLSKQQSSTNGNNNGQAGSSGVKTPPRSGSGVSSVAAAAAAASTTTAGPSTDIVAADQRAQQCGIQKHYAQQVQQQNQLSALHQEELLHSMYKAARKAANRKTKKRIVKGSKIAVAAGAVVTVGVFTAGVGLAAGMVVLGVTAAAGGTGAAASVNKKKSDGKVTTLVLAAVSYEEANRWKKALEASIVSESMNMGDSTWANLFAMEGRDAVSAMVPTEGGGGGKRGVVVGQRGLGVVAEGGGGTAAVGATAAERAAAAVPVREKIRVAEDGRAGVYVEPGTRWRPLEGGWATLLGTGAHGLRIFREEKEDDVTDYYGLAGVGMTFVRAGKEMARMMFSRRQNAVSENRTCPPLKAQIILNASPLDAFMCLMSSAKEHRPDVNVPPPLEFAPNSGQRASFRIVERIDDHMDVIHLVFRPLYLFPSWTTPRDFVLFRYWRFETDGTYIVCYDSVQHRECPPTPNYVRGELHGVYTIAPRKKSRSLSSNQLRRVTRGASLPATQQSHPEYECLLTHVVQVDPRGWVPIVPFPPLASQGYGEAFSVSALLQLLDVRDALDSDRFVDVSLDMQPKPMHIQDFASSLQREQQQEEEQKQPPSPTSLRRGSSAADVNRYVIGRAPSAESDLLDDEEEGSLVLDEEDTVNYDIKYSMRELPSTSLLEVEAHKTISSHPEPLITDWWAEPDANSFRVRGKTYKKDKKKINAGNSLARLVAVDIVEVDAHIMGGFCNHPKERVQQALMREARNRNNGLDSDAPPYTIVINIVLPGPPLYHMVFFYAVDDMSTIDGTNGTPESRLASQFFFGDSDKFRDKTFKLIPHIVAGNFMVKKAVGSTPAIMGMKLKQTYVRSDRFFEILLDVGSSAVAAGVIRLTSSYAKLIVVDMAFLLEGDDETVLPEKVLGCVRLKNVEFGPKLRFVEAVDDD